MYSMKIDINLEIGWGLQLFEIWWKLTVLINSSEYKFKWVLDDSKGKLNAKIWHSNDSQLNMQHPYQLINTNI